MKYQIWLLFATVLVVCSSLCVYQWEYLQSVSVGFYSKITKSEAKGPKRNIYWTRNLTVQDEHSRLSGDVNHASISKAARIAELQEELQRRLEEATERKLILTWFTYPTQGRPSVVDKKKCGNCDFTFDREKITDNATAAVIFYSTAGIKEENLPNRTTRNPNHLYVFWDREPPTVLWFRSKKTMEFEDDYGFNATMSFRRDSDFHDTLYYGSWFSKVLGKAPTGHDLLKFKKRKGIALVSNCGLPGARLRVEVLRKIMETGFELDGYGKCFPENEEFSKKQNMQTKVLEYKFYFSFENSYHCKDYITEKLFRNAFHSRAVPVVLGATKEDYEAVVPPRSVIYVEDFSNVEDLVEYLNYLDKNDTAYMEYFWWHSLNASQLPFFGRVSRHCRLCRVLHGINYDDIYHPRFNASNPKRPLFADKMIQPNVPSIKGWFYDEENEGCLEADETKLKIFSAFNLSADANI